MISDFQPKVSSLSILKVLNHRCIIEAMENPERAAFARRLNELCDENPDEIPPAYKGRQVALATKFNVTPNGARKWLQGDTYPAIDKCIEIAKWSGVNFEWLMTGNGAKRPGEIYPTRAIAHVAEVMMAMEPEQQYKIAQMADLFAPPAQDNDGESKNSLNKRAGGGQ